MRGRLQRKLNNKSGFTLAETLVALAISIILLAITMVGILHYYKNMKLTEMDNTAKEIFIAAQNHLTAADASGELKRYREKALDDTDTSVKKEALGTLIKEKPKDVPDGINWPADNKEYYYIEYNIPSGTTGNLEGSILQYMLPFGAIDETVRADGRYIIEYNVETATVYGVFYAEEDVDFSYLDILTLDKNGGRADTADGRHTRRDYDAGIIGYYGGAMAGNLLSGPTSDLQMDIENKDTLKVTVIDPNYFNKATDGTSTLQTHLTLYVKGKDSGNEVKFTLDLADGANPEKKDKKKDLWWDVETVELKELISGKEGKGLKYTITLDDLTRPGGHFADLFPTLMPGEDIIVKVVSASSTALATVREAEDMSNSLFAARKDGTESDGFKVSTASISSIRHLQNLDPKVSGVPVDRGTVRDKTGKELYKIEYLVTKASLISDMNWEEFFGKKGDVKSVYKPGLKEDAPKDTGWLAEESFYGIYNKNLVEIKGNGKTISNVQIINKSVDEDLTLDNTTAFNAGLLRFVDSDTFTVTNLTLKDFTVSADRNASMLIADVAEGKSVTLTNILVDGGTVKSNKGRGNAGGLIGYTGSKVTVTNSAAVIKSVGSGGRLSNVYAGDAGGLIGEINKCSNSVIENCYTGGQTVDGKYETGDADVYNVYGRDGAGGLVGKINCNNMQIKNSYSTCSVYIGVTPEMPGKGAAGGLVGKGKTAIMYSNCYATGLIKGGSEQIVGTFVGQSNGSDSYVDGCSYLTGINDGSVKVVGEGQKGSSIQSKSYDEMKSIHTDIESYPKDKALDSQTYPFRTVNAVGAKDKINTKGVHYGDWPLEEEKEVYGGKLFAYREKVTVDRKTQDSWYLVDVSVGKDGVITEKKDQYLIKDKESYAESYSYGFLIDEENDEQFESQFKGGIVNFVGDTKNPEIVTIDGKKYKYYQVKSDAERDESGFVTTPQWKLTNKGDGETIQFTFNPDFGCAIEAKANKNKLGTSAHPYEIRSDKQLRKIATSKFADSYNDKEFIQSLDINLTNENFKPFGGDKGFAGKYNALYRDEQGYEINNFTQNISGKNVKAGLITEIGSTGKVFYVTLHGKITAKESYLESIGSLTGVLRGTAKGCYSDVSLEIDNDGSYTGNIGGMIGYVTPNAKIENCHYLTILNTSADSFSVDSSVPDSINIGGLVGYNSGEITNSSAEVKISPSQNNIKGQVGIGGFVGKNTNKGDIRYCWSKVSFSGTAVSNSFFGGFAGIISGEAEINDSYALYLNRNQFNLGFGILNAFVGKNGMTTNDSGIVKNCHAVVTDYNNSMNANNTLSFIDENSLKGDANCYMHRNETSSESGVTYISDSNNYKVLATFKNFDESIWEVVNGKYPTLIANPEPKVSKAKAQSIFKRSLEENLQPKLDAKLNQE